MQKARSVCNYVSSTWSLVVEDTTNNGQQMVEEIILNPANLDGSNNANFRFSVYHNGSDFPSDELVLYVYTIYDVREDITDSDGDGIDDEFDTCPNGETGWTSTPLTDYDSDGCRDATEDDDDDNDIVLDVVDDCSTGELNWVSDSSTDYDGDGCRDIHPEDPDDDNDGYSDTIEIQCNSDPLNEISIPNDDVDGDDICDAQDSDIDGDGIPNTAETDTSVYVDADDTGTSPILADTDGDDWCDGPSIPLTPIDVCSNTDDAFPNDSSAYLDTDSDGLPDELWGPSSTGLVEDLDDDEDSWSDIDEADCGNTDPKDPLSFPIDGDGDGICDLQDAVSLSYNQSGATYSTFEAYVGQSDFLLSPNLTGMIATSWEYSGNLPSDYTFNNGQISGIITTELEQVIVTIWANNSETGLSLNTSIIIDYLSDYDGDGLPDGPSQNGLLEDDDDDNDQIPDIDDSCPKGEIGLAPENDINGDGCSDILTIDLFAMVNRYDLLFFENTSSPLPESCEFDGLNNELIVCIIVTNTDSDNSNISSLIIDQLDVIGLANYTTSQEIDWEWFDVNYRTNADGTIQPRESPLPGVPTIYHNFTKGVFVNQHICQFCLENFDIDVTYDTEHIDLPDDIIFGLDDKFTGEPKEPKEEVGNDFVEIYPTSPLLSGMNKQDVRIVIKVIDKIPEFEQNITLNLTGMPLFELAKLNTGGEVTKWDLIGVSNIIEEDIREPEGTIYVNSQLTTTVIENVTVLYSNSGGEGTFELQLTYYIQEADKTENDNDKIPLWLILFACFPIIILLIMLIFHLLYRRDDFEKALRLKKMDEDRQADERKRRESKDKREHKEKIAELKLEEKKQELLLEQQADRDHTGSDIAVDFADWCLKKLGKHGGEKITKEFN